MLEDTQLVWVRDPLDGYIQGRITEIGSKEFEVTPIDRKFAKRTCHYDDIHSSCDGPQDHDDNCKYIKSALHMYCPYVHISICVCVGVSPFLFIFFLSPALSICTVECVCVFVEHDYIN